MVTTLDARKEMYQAFLDALPLATITSSDTQVTFDNEEFVPPSDAPWVRLVVRHRDSQQETLGGVGNRKFLREGSVIIQVFVPIDEGTTVADAIVDAIRPVYEGITLATKEIRFNELVVREVGPDGQWWQVNVEAFFNYTERR